MGSKEPRFTILARPPAPSPLPNVAASRWIRQLWLANDEVVLPYPSGHCASSRDHSQPPATMHLSTSFAFLQSAMPRHGRHNPCCQTMQSSDRRECPSPIPLRRDREMLHADCPSSAHPGSWDITSPSRFPIEPVDPSRQKTLAGRQSVLLRHIDSPSWTLALPVLILLELELRSVVLRLWRLRQPEPARPRCSDVKWFLVPCRARPRSEPGRPENAKSDRTTVFCP